jgi:hypothetical protein
VGTFRDDRQKHEVIGALLGPRLAAYWGETGPTELAFQVLERGSPTLSQGEALLILFAFDLWNGQGHASLGKVLGVTDAETLRRIGSLLVALSSEYAEEAIDLWIAQECDRQDPA